MDLWVGTAGYSYPSWVGGFYPAGTASADLLPFYARHFPAVEINSSFYRPPSVRHAAKMCRKVPDGFAFALKVPRSASHDRDAAELPAFKLAAQEVHSHGKLLGLLVQVAESFRNGPANRAWLLRIREELRPFPLAVEFRHRSWDVPALPGWLARHGFDCVSVGVPDLPEVFPAGLRPGPRVYARLHSENAANWYAGGPRRYDHAYPEATLRSWAEGLGRAAAGGAERALVFFNNCVTTQAVENARRFAALVREVAPAVSVVGPRAERSLFDGVE